MKKLCLLFLTVCMIIPLVSCGTTRKKPSEKRLNVAISTAVSTLDPAQCSEIDSASLAVNIFSGLVKWSKNENGQSVLVPDCAVAIPQAVRNENGTVTYTYKLRNGLMWSDGRELTAYDFVYAWNRCASPTSSGQKAFLFSMIQGFDDMWEQDSGGNYVNEEAKLSVVALDKRTLSVTLKKDSGCWNELLADPAFAPLRSDASYERLPDGSDDFLCNGPYIPVMNGEQNILLKQNKYYHNADDVTMPEVSVRFSAEAASTVEAYRKGDCQFISLNQSDEYRPLIEEFSGDRLTSVVPETSFLCWNINRNILPVSSQRSNSEAMTAMEEVRKAISLMIDRSYVSKSIFGTDHLPASSFIPRGLKNDDGSEFYLSAGWEDYSGYSDVSAEAYDGNYNNAVKTLRKYYHFDAAEGRFTDFPVIDYVYSSSGSRDLALYFKAALDAVGIPVELHEMNEQELRKAVSSGDFTLIQTEAFSVNFDPLMMLEMWTSNSIVNFSGLGTGEAANARIYSLDLVPYGFNFKVSNVTWSRSYDSLVEDIYDCTDGEKRTTLLHFAEDLLMENGCIMPIVFGSDSYLFDSRLSGLYVAPTGYRYFYGCYVLKENQ